MIDPPYYTQSQETNVQDAVLEMFFFMNKGMSRRGRLEGKVFVQ